MIERTEFAEVRFKACENEQTPYLCTEENGPPTNSLVNEHFSLGLRLRDGITFEQAQSVADYLNRYVTRISVRFKK